MLSPSLQLQCTHTMDFRAHQLGHLISYTPHNWRYARFIFMAAIHYIQGFKQIKALLLIIIIITILIIITSLFHMPTTLCSRPHVPSPLLKFYSTYCLHHLLDIHHTSLQGHLIGTLKLRCPKHHSQFPLFAMSYFSVIASSKMGTMV